MSKELTDGDVYFLIGDAELRRKECPDICDYEYELAEKIALAIGDQAMAERVIEVKKEMDNVGGIPGSSR